MTRPRLLTLVLIFLATTFSFAADSISVRTVDIGGIKIHYMTAGRGPAILLLHGYAENSLMWKPLIPMLSDKFTVIGPDLPGIGESSIPTDGLDMKTAGLRMHDFVKSRGIEK